MIQKENRRSAISKRMLKDALIELLREKDIYHISIRELCEVADVNRTTFYKYFDNQFALLADMENDVILAVEKTASQNSANVEATICALCEYLEANLEFTRLLINNNIDPTFPQKLFSLGVVKENFLKNCAGKYDDTEIDYLYQFVTYGCFQIISVWLNKEDRESPQKLAAMISGIKM